MSDKQEKQIIVDFRTNQSSGSQLCEYLTGMRPNNPNIMERLSTDRKLVLERYELPDDELLKKDPLEFENKLRQRAKDSNIDVLEDDRLTGFLKENMVAGVFHSQDVTTEIIIDRTNEKTLVKSLKTFRHELLHGLQYIIDPTMSIEQSEYEAHVANLNEEYLRKHPKDIELIFFQFLMGGSILKDYKLVSKGAEVERQPVWRDPKWWLKNVDKIEE